MDELEIKAKVLSLVRRASKRGSFPIVSTEFNIADGRTRADLAILGDEFVGIEIKSAKDKLIRLPKQAQDYRSYFDRFVLVLDPKHLTNYLKIDLKYCDVWTFDENQILRRFSEGHHRSADEQTLFDLLTQSERESFYRNPAFAGKSKREAFNLIFRDRYGSTSKEFWKAVRRREIYPKDVKTLSRFYKIKKEAEQIRNRQTDAINEWVSAYSSDNYG